MSLLSNERNASFIRENPFPAEATPRGFGSWIEELMFRAAELVDFFPEQTRTSWIECPAAFIEVQPRWCKPCDETLNSTRLRETPASFGASLTSIEDSGFLLSFLALLRNKHSGFARILIQMKRCCSVHAGVKHNSYCYMYDFLQTLSGTPESFSLFRPSERHLPTYSDIFLVTPYSIAISK